MAPRYEFVRMLGQGGSGWVALADDTRLGRSVAVKTIYGATTDPEAVARLRREAKALAAAVHPHVAKVYSLLTAGADIFVVMEYAAGGDLGEALLTGRLSGSAAVRVLRETAAALDYSASLGIVHRDVKPANILLTEDLRAKLADFGLARLPRAANAFRTLDGSLSGTASYLAPEQIDPQHQGPSIDAYAYATVAYQVLTGSLPFGPLDFVSALRARQTEVPKSPLEAAPGLPLVVAEALLGGLVRDPVGRLAPMEIATVLGMVPDDEWDRLLGARIQADRTPLSSDTVTASPEVGRNAVRPPPTFSLLEHELDDADIDTRVAHRDAPSIAPPVYRPPKVYGKGRSRARWVGAVIGIVIGGLAAFLLLQL